MYRRRLWTMRQYAGFGTAEESNRRYRYLLSQGTTGLSVAFDLPTQMGMDSDHPMAAGEVGRAGVAISSLADMERLFEGIPLDRVSTSMTINSTAAILLACYALVAERQGADRRKLSGTIQNDILKEYIARGTYIYPPRAAMRIITDIFAWAGREMPEWNTISISGYHIREAGSTAVEELAFTFANAIAYIEAALAAGLAVDDFAPRLSFFFNSHNDFLEEIAKFRAARRLYATLMRERFGARDPRSTHAALPRADCRQYPDRAAARRQYRAHRAPGDGRGARRRPKPAYQLARRGARTAHRRIGAARSAHAADHRVRNRHRQHRRSAGREPSHRGADATRWKQESARFWPKSSGNGGTLRAIETGWIQAQIQDSAYGTSGRSKAANSVVVGVNRFQQEAECAASPPSASIPRWNRRRSNACAQVRASRSAPAVAERLAQLERAARDGSNLMPSILQAASAYVTVGEISDRLRVRFRRVSRRSA